MARRTRIALALVPSVLGALLALLAAAAWLILAEPPAAHTALQLGTALVAIGGLLSGGITGRLAETPDQEARREDAVRGFGLATRLLALGAVAFVAAAALLATRDGMLPTMASDRVARLLAAFLLCATAGLAGATLFARRQRPRGRRAGTVGLAFALVLPAFAVLLRLYAPGLLLRLPSVPPGIVALGVAAVVGLAMPAARGVHGLGHLLRPRSEGAMRVAGTGRAFVPLAIAFALVLVLFLAAVTFGVGVGPVVREVGRSPALAAAAGFILLLLLASIASVAIASRQTRTAALFQEKADPRQRFERILLASSLALALVFLVPAALDMAGVLDLPGQAWRHLLCIGTLLAVGPYGFYVAREQKRIRRLELRFPDFLRDVASSHKGGLTLPAAISVAARGEYGPLTPEVRKMADQLQWNVPFTEALQLFSERVRTPLVQRAVNLILEANRTGGSTTGLLLAAARDAREIKSLETERRLSMSLYTVVIYVTFYVFLGVAAVLYAQFIPQLVASSEAAADAAQDGVELDGLGGGGISLQAFQKFYFLAGVLQGVGDGLVAGMMGSGRVLLGLQHAFWMVLSAYLVFGFLL